MKNTVQKYLFYLKHEKHSTKVFILFETEKPKVQKECFTTYINHQGEIFNVVNKLHIKYKKMQKRFRFCILHSPNITPNSLYTLISIYG